MVDHPQDRKRSLARYVEEAVPLELPPSTEALLTRMIQRVYLRRWLIALAVIVIFVFVAIYSLPLLPASLGAVSIVAGAAILPREGGIRPLRLNLGESDSVREAHILAGMLEGLPSPVILLDAQGRIVRFNELATDLWPNLSPDNHISGFIRDPGVLQAVAGADGTMRPRQMVPYEQRVPIERHMEATISWVAQRHRAPREHAPAIMLHLRDLTEQEQLDQLRTDFVANASHELRTPLASLIGFIETLQGAARHDNAARENFLEIMARQAQRMARLIDNLLSLSRIEMRAHLRPQTRVDLIDVAEYVLADLEPLAEQTGIHFHFHKNTNSAWVLGDRDELGQVIANLVENSIKYGRHGGNVWLSIDKDTHGAQSKLRLTVRDDGEGIDEKHLPRLTERFYRANDNGGERSGTGLGLAIVKHVVARHRGDLKIASEIGKGSVFSIVLSEVSSKS